MKNGKEINLKKQERIINNLYKSLSFSKYSIIAFGGYGFISYVIISLFLEIIAVVYFIYLAKTLYLLKKYKWLTALIVSVSVPIILKYLFFKNNRIAAGIMPMLSLLIFYLFCFIIKFSVSDWLEDARYELL